MNTVVRLGFIVTILLILALTVTPIHRPTFYPEWSKVTWIPFGDRHLIARDMIANSVLFVPFGALGPWRSRRLAARLAIAVGWACALSISVEFCQVFSSARRPTATDVATNAAGALLGALFPVTTRRRARA